MADIDTKVIRFLNKDLKSVYYPYNYIYEIVDRVMQEFKVIKSGMSYMETNQRNLKKCYPEMRKRILEEIAFYYSGLFKRKYKLGKVSFIDCFINTDCKDTGVWKPLSIDKNFKVLEKSILNNKFIMHEPLLIPRNLISNEPLSCIFDGCIAFIQFDNTIFVSRSNWEGLDVKKQCINYSSAENIAIELNYFLIEDPKEMFSRAFTIENGVMTYGIE